MRRHKTSRRVRFPKRAIGVTSPRDYQIRTTTESPTLHSSQPEGQPGFVIQGIDDEIEAESGDLSERSSTSTPSTAASLASTTRPAARSNRNIFPITRYWGPSTLHAPEMASQTATIPFLFTTLPPMRDLLQTQSSTIQDQTVQTCLPFLSNPLNCNSHGIPHLLRDKHIRFLNKSLEQLPAPYTGVDASRPWLLYWALCGLSTMGEDVSHYRERVMETVRSMQNRTGGFGGGFGQLSHLATTYAVVLALGIVGCAGDAGDDVLRETMGVIDRRAMWEWLGRLKCPDGGFKVCEDGEEDVRGVYCATVIITLLSLPLTMPPASTSSISFIPSQVLPPSIKLLTDLLPDYVSRCQTFEGGISGQPDVEAHGAYAFCALACLSILFQPTEILSRKLLDIPKLINWLSARQYSPEGGFAGRTNKLVDGCYSHWVGGCWPIIEAILSSPASSDPQSKTQDQDQNEKGKDSAIGRGKERGVLYSREGLIRYIMCCCQDTGRRGGLRDKPGKFSDSYHTCYVLAGLSSAMWQNHYSTPAHLPQPQTQAQTETFTSPLSINNPPQELKAANGNSLTAPYGWTGTPYSWDNNLLEKETEAGTGDLFGSERRSKDERGIDETQIFDEEDRVQWIHPIFVVPQGVAERVRGVFLGRKDEWVD